MSSMGTEYQRNFMVTVREVAYCLRRQHMSHDRRRKQMVILSLMIGREREDRPESDFNNTCRAIQDVLRHITNDDTLTHTGVNAGLALIETIAQQRIEDWFVAETDPGPGNIPF